MELMAVLAPPSPRWGGNEGGVGEPRYSGSRDPLPAFPIKGEVPFGGWAISECLPVLASDQNSLQSFLRAALPWLR